MIPSLRPCPMRRLFCLLLFSLTTLRAAGTEEPRRNQAEAVPGEPGRYRWVCTVRGDTFHEVRVTKVTASQISLLHATGVATLPLIV